jgi:hypothetical protein
MIVYLITNMLNNKRYTGQTIRSLNDRWKFHVSDASMKLNVNPGQIHNVLSGKNSHVKGYTFARVS